MTAHVQERLSTTVEDQRKQLHLLQEQLERAVAERDEYSKYIRELEQSNDDLERAKRCLAYSPWRH